MDNTNTEYNDSKNRIPWLRMIITALIVAIIIFIILLLIRNCGKKSLRGDLVKAAQEYYEKDSTKLPKEVGECEIVTLKTLEDAGLVDSSKYSTCDKTKTYVNVCYLENLKYNYAATLLCDVETTKYGMWKDGTPTDLTDGSDVRFLFIGEQYTEVEEGLTSDTVKYYYPSNATNANNVKEYYIATPAKGYTGKDNQATGYKWYTENTEKTYWNNGEYSATAPLGYTSRDSETTITKFSETKPADASYRTITDVTLYKYQVKASAYKYKCVVPGTTNPYILSPYHCALNESGLTQVYEAYYSCDGGETEVPFGTICQAYTDWSTEVCTSKSNIDCQSKSGYQYTDTVYKWYTTNTVRKYYPSGSTTASGEKTYYVSSPTNGAIKDESTGAQVYKFYKASSSSSANMVEKWVQVTNGYVGIDELIQTFKNLDYNVNSLTDIKSLQDIRYQYKMQYRNVEE